MSSELIIDRATLADLDGIMTLQADNQPERGGNLAASFNLSQITYMIVHRPVVVARRDHQVVAFLMNSKPEMNQDIPIIAAMFDAYQASSNSYIYGPVCVREDMRGQGLAQAMFNLLRSMEEGREAVLFIRKSNVASIRAHEKMGMKPVASFQFAEEDYLVLSYLG